MQRFQELLTEAAQLKESQLKNQRKNYQSLPEYLKAGLNYAKKFEILRKQNYLIQMNLSEKLKKQGNNFFNKQQYDEALSKYQEALSIFRYIIATSYENMKDEDLQYRSFSLDQNLKQYQQQYSNHLLALYLNICSCLTKKNKKEDAIHSADEALKIKETAKTYYKKAQAYLQFINRETSDIKLGFYYLNKSYQISKDQSIVQEMHRIKKELDQQRNKEKTWFKFMFDKNSQANSKAVQAQKIKQPIQKKVEIRNENIKKLEQQKRKKSEQKEDQKLERTKQKLAKYLNLDLKDQVWLECYQGEFIAKHGSKIYSIIQLYGYKQLLGEYRALLAHSLEVKRQNAVQRRRQAFVKYFQWLKSHPVDQISKYLQRYELQTKWIRAQREAIMRQKQREKQLDFQNKQDKQVEALNNQKIQNQLNTLENNQETNTKTECQNLDLKRQPEISQQNPSLLQQINKITQAKAQTPQMQSIPQPSVKENIQNHDYPKESSKIKYLSIAIALLIVITIRFLL